MHIKLRHSNCIFNSDDTRRFTSEVQNLTNFLDPKKRELEKASTRGTSKVVRNTNILWRKAEDRGIIGKSVKFKFKFLASASDHAAPIVIQFYRFLAKYLKAPLVQFNLRGFSIGSKVKNDYKDMGSVIMTNKNAICTYDDITLTEKIMK